MAEAANIGACAECGGAGYVVRPTRSGTAGAQRCQCQVECPRCHETGYVLVPAGSTSIAQPCPCRHLDQRLALYNAIGVPGALAGESFETFKVHPGQAVAKASAEDFARKFRTDVATRGFLLYGKPGCGKTHLLAAALRYLALEKGVSSRYVEFMLLLSDIRAGFSTNKSHMEIIGPLATVTVLAIDELGKDRGTEWERSMLDELISRRYNSGLATLFATNYPRDPEPIPTQPGRRVSTGSPEFRREAETMSLEERVGQRVFSRLREMCDFAAIEGPDYRPLRKPGSDRWH
jgi:DNA replication protein DnaC